MEEIGVLRHWTTDHTNIFVSLAGFTVFTVSNNSAVWTGIFSRYHLRIMK